VNHNGPKTDHNVTTTDQKDNEDDGSRKAAKTNEEDGSEDVRTNGEVNGEDDGRRRRQKRRTVRENDGIDERESREDERAEQTMALTTG